MSVKHGAFPLCPSLDNGRAAGNVYALSEGGKDSATIFKFVPA
jgi:hypothetical protein